MKVFSWFNEDIIIKRGVLFLSIVISLLLPYIRYFRYGWTYDWFVAYYVLMIFVAFQIFLGRKCVEDNKEVKK